MFFPHRAKRDIQYINKNKYVNNIVGKRMVVAKERGGGGGTMPSLQNSTNSHRISTTQMHTFTSPQEAPEEDKKDPSNKPGVSQWSLTRSSKAQVEQTQTGTVFKAKPNATKKTERCHNAPFFPPETSLPKFKSNRRSNRLVF